MLLPSGPPWLRRVLIATVALVLLVGIYAVVGFVGVPRWLRSGATDYVRTHYHRALSLGEVRFNPFTLTLDLHDIAFPDQDSTPMVGASGLHVQLRLAASIWRRAASFREIILDRPFVHALIRPDGSLNLGDLAKPTGEPSPPPAAPPAKSAPLRLVIDRLSVSKGRTAFDDRSRPTPFHAELVSIDFDLSDFSTIRTASDEYSLDFATPLGERFHWGGTLGLDPVASRGRFQVSALRAGTLASFMGDALPLEISSGVIELQGDYALAVGASEEMRVDVSHLALSDLGIRPRKSTTDDIHLKLLDVERTHVDLARRSVSVGAVRVTGGTIAAWINPDGTLNLSALMARPAPAPATQPSANAATQASAPAWSLSAPDVSVAGLELRAEDRRFNPATTLDLADIAVQVRGYQMPGDSPLNLSLGVTVNRTGRLQATGTYALKSGVAHAQLKIAQIDLTALQPYVAQRSALNLLSGQLAASLTVDQAADGALTVSGDTSVARLRTVDQQLRQDFVTWDRLSVEGIQYRSRPAAVRIRRIVATKPFARIIIASNRTLNIREALSPAHAESPSTSQTTTSATPVTAPAPASQGAAAAPSAASSRTAAAMPISIGRVQISDASARYTDLWIQPHFTLAIQDLSGYITGMSSAPGSRAKMQLDGKVDRYAPIAISGELNLLAAQLYTDLKMSFQGVELTTATPYSARFAGYKIEKGKISAEITYHIENGSLTANHHIVIDQLQLGDRVESPDAVKLPLKLAVALLRDRNGVIDLGLPVTGSLSDPQFKIGPLIWKVVVNVLEKAATAPFALLGKLFGGGPEIKFIDFDAGSSSLDASDRQRLTTIVKALQDRPSLELDVPSAYTPDLDRAALGTQLLQSKLLDLKSHEAPARKRGGARPVPSTEAAPSNTPAPPDASALADPAEHFRLLAAEYRSELGKDATFPAEAQTVLDAQRKKKKGADAPPLDPAINVLQSALLARINVSDDDLQALGRHRARAIQEVLLGDGKIPPARLFVLSGAPTQAVSGRVRLELGLK